MAAPKGNQFWKLRSKHGRDKLFETPDLLWEAACEYFQWCEDNPIKKNDFRGKDADEVIYELDRPFTLSGLCIYLGCSSQYFRNFEKNNKDSEDFMAVITCVKEIIFTQKFEGASVGIFNANIIARDLGLTDKKELKHEGLNLGKAFEEKYED